jgi:hypothetical protein
MIEKIVTLINLYQGLQNFLLITLGAVIYFVMEFKSRSDSPFILGYWLKSNVPNLFFMYLTWLAWYFIYGPMTKEIAFVWGLIPNMGYDWVQDMIRKFKKNSNGS